MKNNCFQKKPQFAFHHIPFKTIPFPINIATLQIKLEKSSTKDSGGAPDKPELTVDESAALALANHQHRQTVHAVEGLALVLLCSCRPIVRKRAVSMLKEVRHLFNVLDIPKVIKEVYEIF